MKKSKYCFFGFPSVNSYLARFYNFLYRDFDHVRADFKNCGSYHGIWAKLILGPVGNPIDDHGGLTHGAPIPDKTVAFY